MAVITDRSHGGTSLKDGQIEIMLHRRLLARDYHMLTETLDEPGSDGRGLVVRGKHWLTIEAGLGSAPHPAYSPDIAPFGYYLFRDLAAEMSKIIFKKLYGAYLDDC
uniref:Glycosyl hydrolase family 38 C-terminal domain-containing protein n=1 Tax=Acrobeloides nanus TaxID=290746 RepID=A0A914E3N0_9BILA